MDAVTVGSADLFGAEAPYVPATALNDHGQYFEYSQASNPVHPDLTPRIPYQVFAPSLYTDGSTRVISLDLSAELRCEEPATGPELCANFVKIEVGLRVDLDPVATSMIFYVIRGSSVMTQRDITFEWAEGDLFSAPAYEGVGLWASTDAALYYVNDAPLLRYLSARPNRARFEPRIYKAESANAELAKVANDQDAANRSRISVLLGNENFPQTRTVTHTLWTMYGMIGAGTEQKLHRHQSIALDYIVGYDEGVYSLLGRAH